MLPHQKTSSCSPQLFLLLLRCQWVLIQNAFFVLLLLLLSCFVSNSVQSHRRQPNRLPVPGILQARTLEWVAISFSNAWKWKVKVKSLSRVRLLATPWTAAYQAPPSMGFARQEYWSGVPLPSPSNHLYTALWEPTSMTEKIHSSLALSSGKLLRTAGLEYLGGRPEKWSSC